MNGTPHDLRELNATYDSHPFQKRTILARLRRQGIVGTLEEPHLALDPVTEITDQNHVGGAAFVAELAQAASITAEDVVVDVGAGLGGSCRLLAYSHGCRTWGVERHPARAREAIELTELVRLTSKVAIVSNDALTTEAPVRPIDVLWGQSAWVHFPDKRTFLSRWTSALGDGGRVALEDAYLRRVPSTRREEELIGSLAGSWHAHFIALDEWRGALEEAACSIVALVDLTDRCMTYFQRLLDVSQQWPSGDLSPAERAGWVRAIAAIEAGLMGYCRIVGVYAAQRPSAADRTARSLHNPPDG